MSVMASQIPGVWIVCSTVCSDADQRKHQSSALLAFVRGIHRWLMDSPHKGTVTLKMFSFDDVIMSMEYYVILNHSIVPPEGIIFRVLHGTQNVCQRCKNNQITYTDKKLVVIFPSLMFMKLLSCIDLGQICLDLQNISCVLCGAIISPKGLLWGT